MSVNFNSTSDASFPVSKFIWANTEAVEAIVRHLLVGQSEAHCDMLLDEQEGMDGELTRQYVEETLNGNVPQAAIDLTNDVIPDLLRAVQERLNVVKYKARVTALHFDSTGVDDISVDITVE